MVVRVSLSIQRAFSTGLSANQVRKAFIDFFVQEKNHVYYPSSSVVPQNDSSLMFVNAGMNQFKPIFEGASLTNSDLDGLKRAANTQKCIRAGGKHNDLEDVGKDLYHHTFFEMLGNWSFGDYFKTEICNWAWEFLTSKLEIPPQRLYVTYFAGDPVSSLAADEECRQIWLDVGVPPSHILPFGMKDNFWEMGDLGPCGPCSEIHFDRVGGGRNAAQLVNSDDPSVVEIWNLVFMQFSRGGGGQLHSLPHKHIDCGLGLERLVAVMQDKVSNYDTDLFMHIFATIQKVTGAPPYTGRIGAEDVNRVDTSYRIVADHLRTLTVGLSDGVKPGPHDRGYLMRRILRRAVRYAGENLDAKPGHLASVVPVIVESLGETFPELCRNSKRVMQIINTEENRYRALLRDAVRICRETIREEQSWKSFPGDFAWKLQDSHGFPLELTQDVAAEHGLTVDIEQYKEARRKSGISDSCV